MQVKRIKPCIEALEEDAADCAGVIDTPSLVAGPPAEAPCVDCGGGGGGVSVTLHVVASWISSEAAEQPLKR